MSDWLNEILEEPTTTVPLEHFLIIRVRSLRQ